MNGCELFHLICMCFLLGAISKQYINTLQNYFLLTGPGKSLNRLLVSQ